MSLRLPREPSTQSDSKLVTLTEPSRTTQSDNKLATLMELKVKVLQITGP